MHLLVLLMQSPAVSCHCSLILLLLLLVLGCEIVRYLQLTNTVMSWEVPCIQCASSHLGMFIQATSAAGCMSG